jgi:DNA-directed RNA polymerase subunit L
MEDFYTGNPMQELSNIKIQKQKEKVQEELIQALEEKIIRLEAFNECLEKKIDWLICKKLKG